jgi:hypothetical protein
VREGVKKVVSPEANARKAVIRRTSNPEEKQVQAVYGHTGVESQANLAKGPSTTPALTELEERTL